MMTYIGCGERVREKEGGGRDSFRISKCLLGSACAFSLGGREGEKKESMGGGGGGGKKIGGKKKEKKRKERVK